MPALPCLWRNLVSTALCLPLGLGSHSPLPGALSPPPAAVGLNLLLPVLTSEYVSSTKSSWLSSPHTIYLVLSTSLCHSAVSSWARSCVFHPHTPRVPMPPSTQSCSCQAS